MAIPFLSEIEKLITEHGSAAILKERIALANDKYAMLEQKLSESTVRAEAAEARANNLESENEALKLDNKQFQEKIGLLEEQLSEKGHHALLAEQRLVESLNEEAAKNSCF